jgi:hypothetical protein
MFLKASRIAICAALRRLLADRLSVGLNIPYRVQFLGAYNFVRVHKTLGSTPAVAAGIEFERWSLERVVEMTEAFNRGKEDAKFEAAFAALKE